jgi:hypothetical protein
MTATVIPPGRPALDAPPSGAARSTRSRPVSAARGSPTGRLARAAGSGSDARSVCKRTDARACRVQNEGVGPAGRQPLVVAAGPLAEER